MEAFVVMGAAGLAFLGAACFISVAIFDFLRGAAAGALRSGSRVSVTDRGSPSRARAERRCTRYPEGARVTVFYDPAHPGRAVLERGVGSGPLALFAWGGLTLAGGVYIVRVLCGLGGALPELVLRICGG